ncbi:MAG TPA: GNAT family N-acetyltransferase [Flavipsychrobacter sp.]|nr:GNAT family N-acetyltransferase [Flavipsychrobacter sp.]
MTTPSAATNEIAFKRITQQHIPQLIELRLEFLISLKGRQTQEKIDALIKHLHQYYNIAIPAETFAGWMAWVNEKAVGVGALVVREQPGQFDWPEGRLGYVLNMYTVPEYRKRGICSTILQELINYAKDTGLSRLELHAAPDGEPVYRKYGFEEWKEPFLMLRFK